MAVRTSPTTNVLKDAQKSLLTPMEFFDAQVAAGQATINTAKNCLTIHLENITKYKAVMSAGSSQSKSHGFGSVLHWLWSSRQEESMEFIRDHQFVRVLMELLVLEGRQERFSHWLSRVVVILRENEAAPETLNNDLVVSATHLTQRFLQANLKIRSDLNSAMAIYLKVSNFLESESSLCYKRLLWPSTTYLSKALTDRESHCKLDVALYDQFIEKTRIWNSSLALTGLELCHPTHPDPSLALRSIRRVLKTMPKSTPVLRKKFVLLCLKTAQVLLEDGSNEDALWVMGILQDNFAEDIGEPRPAFQPSSPDDRPPDLGSLEALATI